MSVSSNTRAEPISNLTKKCALVEDLGDRLYYLSEALAAVDKINEEMVIKLRPRERVLCFKALMRWQNVIIEARDRLKGRAILQVELLAKHAFPGEQVVLALKLQNTGQALAENVTVRLEPLADYEIIDQPSQHVAGIPITSPKLFFGRQDVFDFVLENLVGAE